MNLDAMQLRHKLNLDYPKYNNGYDNQTDKTLNRIMNNFIHKYINKFKTDTFILLYNDDILGILSYYILKNIQGVYNFNLKVIGKTKQTNKFFYNKEDIIKKRELKHYENIIFLSCFNPLYYVKNPLWRYKNLSNYDSLIAEFTPDQLLILCRFFKIDLTDSKKYLNILFNKQTIRYSAFCNRHNIKLKHYFLKWINNNYNDSIIPTKIIKFKGNEEDFPLFNIILKQDSKYIFNYECPKNKVDFIITNLNPFISAKNAFIIGYNVKEEDE